MGERVEGVLDAHAQRMADLTDMLCHADREHGLRDHFEGQLHHFSGDVYRTSRVIFPCGNSLLPDLGYAIGHRGHPGAVKDRLDDAAMALPDLIRTGHQSIAKHQREAGWPLRIVDLHETIGLLDENFFSEIGMTEQIERLRPEPKAEGIAVPAPPGQEHLQRLLLERTQVTKQRHRAGNIDKREGGNRVRHENGPYHIRSGASTNRGGSWLRIMGALIGPAGSQTIILDRWYTVDRSVRFLPVTLDLA